MIDFVSFIILGSVILSWIQLPREHPLMRLSDTLTEPLLAPVRKLLPAAGGLDFSPMIVLIALQILKGLLH
ncbi:MAG: YggT family protein [Myxococcota bacterium]